MKYDRTQILAKFALAGVQATYEGGATREQLRELDLRDRRAAYVQVLFDEIIKANEDPAVQQNWDKYPLNIRIPLDGWDRQRELKNSAYPIYYEQALGYRPWGDDVRPKPTVAPVVAPVDVINEVPSEPAEEPGMTPEQKAERKRTLSRERVRRFRQKRAEEAKEASALRRDEMVAEEKRRRKAFGGEYSGNPDAEEHKGWS